MITGLKDIEFRFSYHNFFKNGPNSKFSFFEIVVVFFFTYFFLKIDISGEHYLYHETKYEEKKKLWARARYRNIWCGGVKIVVVERGEEGAG